MKNELTKNEEIALEALERIAEESKAEGSHPFATRAYVQEFCFKGGEMKNSRDVENALNGLYLKGKAVKLAHERCDYKRSDGPAVLWASASVLDE